MPQERRRYLLRVLHNGHWQPRGEFRTRTAAMEAGRSAQAAGATHFRVLLRVTRLIYTTEKSNGVV